MEEGWRREGPLQRGEHAHVCTCVQSQENLEGISQVLSTSGFLSVVTLVGDRVSHYPEPTS